MNEGCSGSEQEGMERERASSSHPRSLTAHVGRRRTTMLKSGRWARRHTARVFGFVAVAALLGSGALVQNAQASRLHATTITLWSGISGSDQTGFKKIIDGFN